MTWIQTYTGKAFDVFAPRAEDVDPDDIIHALSMLCRFGGHTRWFYSVAQHSVLVANETAHVDDPAVPRYGLLHDAAEAYLCDLPRPIKRAMPQYSLIEKKVLAVIFERFGMPLPIAKQWAAVKHADDVLLATEARDLLVPPPMPWLPLPEPRERKLFAVGHEEAKWQFQTRMRQLGLV